MKQVILSIMLMTAALSLNAQDLKNVSSDGNEKDAAWLEIRSQIYESSTIVKDGQVAPDFLAYTMDGTQIRLSDYKGKVIHLSFWATWCGPCLKELKAENLPATLKPFMGHPDYVYLPIAQDSIEKLEQFFSGNKGAQYAWLKDITLVDGERILFHSYAEKFIPRNVIIDRDGKVAVTCIGENPYEAKVMEATLTELLKEEK